jgi:peptide/nickel transport system permease protein
MWSRGVAWDLWLLAGGLIIGTVGGVLAGLWCVRRPRSLPSRFVESSAMVLFCAPVYVVGLLILKAFNPTFGILPLPAFFDANPKWVTPWGAPWDWFRQLLVPWLVLAAPLGAMCLRLTLNTTLEAMDEDYVPPARPRASRRAASCIATRPPRPSSPPRRSWASRSRCW